MAMKKAAARPQDLEDVESLRALRDSKEQSDA
jgi:hypothetical protein